MSIIDYNLIDKLRVELRTIVEKVTELKPFLQNDELFQRLAEIKQHIQSPFLFVVVGEVKAGKSSFINALLGTGEEICKVAPSPMTDRIQLIKYGESVKETKINDFVTEITQPVDILRHIAIVDTPGTNTIIRHHQEITERFIPSSDLIIFVFEAKNPYRQSAWEFLDFIYTDWQKKIIFVLQQKDLMPPADLQINIQGVEKYAKEKGISKPVIFALSAKEEQEHLLSSGFAPLRKYVDENITGHHAVKLKFESSLSSIRNATEKLHHLYQVRRNRYLEDKKFREEIKQLLDQQEKASMRQLNLFTENICNAYDQICTSKKEAIAAELSFFSLLGRSFKAVFGQKESLQTWLLNLNKTFEEELQVGLKQKLSEGIIHLSESVQQMGLMVDQRVKEQILMHRDQDTLFQESLTHRLALLTDLHESFKNFISDSSQYTDKQLFSSESNIPTSIATGGGIAVIGIILAAVSSGMVFDITGGVLTGIGLLFAGVTAGLKRKSILSGFEEATAQGKTQLNNKLNADLSHYIHKLREKIEDNFHTFDQFQRDEADRLIQMEKIFDETYTRLSDLKLVV